MNDFLWRVKNIAKLVFRRARIFLDSHPKFKRNTLVLITNLGLLNISRICYGRMIAAANESDLEVKVKAFRGTFIAKGTTDLSSRANKIYRDLKAAIKKNEESC